MNGKQPIGLLILWIIVVWIFIYALIHDYPNFLGISDKSGSETLRNLTLFVTAVIGLPIVLWRGYIADLQARASQEQSLTAQRSFLNTRFQSGAEMLGHEDINVRIGGIYSLGKLAKDDIQTYHIQVMQLLCAYVVERTKTNRKERESKLSDLEIDKIEDEERQAKQKLEAYLTINCVQSANFDYGISSKFVSINPDWVSKDVYVAMSVIGGRNSLQIKEERDNDEILDLSSAILGHLYMNRPNFENINFTGADFRNSRIDGASFRGCLLIHADFSDVSLAKCDFREAYLDGANFTCASLISANFKNLDFHARRRIPKSGIDPFATRFSYAEMSHSNLEGSVLSNVDLRGAFLNSARLTKAIMNGVHMNRAVIKCATLVDSEIAAADFGYTLCVSTDFSRTKLHKTNLEGAILAGSNFDQTELRSSVISDAAFITNPLDPKLRTAASGLTQAQLDEALAHEGRPPLLDGIEDAFSGNLLVWRGESPSEFD